MNEWGGDGWWESMEPMEEVPLIVESELERLRYDTRCHFNVRSKANMSQLNLPHGNLPHALARGWRREAGSWFQRRREACWKERSVIRRENNVDGRAWPKVKSECYEEAEQWWGYADMKVGWLWELAGKWKELVFNAFGYFLPVQRRRMEVMWLDFWICWSRVI